MKNNGLFIMIALFFNCFILSLEAQENKWTKYLNYEPFYFINDGITEEYEIIPRTAKDFGLKGNVNVVENEFKAGYQIEDQENKYKFAKAVSFFENGFIYKKYLRSQKSNYTPKIIKETEYVYGNEAIVNGKIYSINRKVKEKYSNTLKQEGPKIDFKYRYTNGEGKTSYTNGDLLELMIYVGEDFKIQRIFTKEGRLYLERRYRKSKSQTSENSDFYLSKVTSFTHDDQMRVTKKRVTKVRPNGSYYDTTTHKYSYKEVGDDLQVKVLIDEGNRKTETLKTYNSSGLLISENQKYTIAPSNIVSTSTYKFEYEYDLKGNWVKRKLFKLDSDNNYKLTQTSSRKISYHD